MTLREQLVLKRSLRRLRTWAPPISIGIIVGAGAFIVADHIAPPRAQSAPLAFASPAPTSSDADCDAARAAGAAPVYRGQRGYGAHLDRDSDGVGCEPYPR
jgi:hypothetical protein